MKGVIMEQFGSQTIREIVTQNYRTAAVFEKYSLDFCCKGGRTIDDACKEKNINAEAVMEELRNLNGGPEADLQRFNQWNADFLTAYIVENHHGYIRAVVPAMLAHTRKVAMVHGERHPEMVRAAELFATVAADLMNHMQKEEMMLFPFIVSLYRSMSDKAPVPSAPFGSVNNPIAMMEHEHDAAGTMMYEIRELTKNYVPPEDACTTYRVTLQELKEFEHDLHRHVHLENNILFPKAKAMEAKLEMAS
jgi:regulator of cell morphogenesis and NO signaling